MISLHMNMRFPYLNTTKQMRENILGRKITNLLKPQFYMTASRRATSILLAV